jgi:hypothetical protein
MDTRIGVEGLIEGVLAKLTLGQLAELGRPYTAPDKHRAEFMHSDMDGLFHYRIYGKRFLSHDRLKVESLRKRKAGQSQNEHNAELVKLLERTVSLNRDTVARNAVARIKLNLTNFQVEPKSALADAMDLPPDGDDREPPTNA